MNRDEMQQALPQRIKPDAIVEAVLEIRFCPDQLPEIFLGRVLTARVLQGLTATRLPQADIPMSARESDASLRFQPVYQLEGENELIRVGTGAISLHALHPYSGWEAFSGRARDIIEEIWSSCGSPPLERCGLRYINALTSDGHGVQSMTDLNLRVSVGEENLVDVTVSFIAEDAGETESLVRVASSKHVQGELPAGTTFVVDIDVRTTGAISNWSSADLLDWLEGARKIKNEHFFRLLPERIIQTLKEE